ncbi:unnamed protein product [Brassicogethes aeneus]|uniref:Peptidase M14 domain-containing protein n=1 Tax=Brassicogethes aeneus TaxID=1431903 RepID=A0A9P0FHY7_BRAAE|nr:unnamed protein product [Brassicogethes aeneus]
MLNVIFIILLLCSIQIQCNENPKYKSNEELKKFMEVFNKTSEFYNVSARLYTIGKSENNFPLQVIEITAVNDTEKLGVPNVKLIANIHGNEPAGREVLIRFLEYLRENYRKDKTVTWLLENTKIHVLPAMNPDGFDQSSPVKDGTKGRENRNKIDLNRSFPDYFYPDHYKNNKKAAESEAVIQWMKKVPFVLSAGFHGGSLVANYPFDAVKNTVSGQQSKESKTSDDDVFVHLAKTYSLNHKTMHKNRCDNNDKYFKDGIANGATWYIVHGGMGDYSYAYEGCMEVSLEITCWKYPEPTELENIWEENKNALIEYCKKANMGVTGQILNSENNKPIEGAQLKIKGRDMTFKSKTKGQFWRILLPGNYTIQVKADGYHDTQVEFKVKKQTSEFPKLTFLRIRMLNSSISTTTRSTTSTTASPKTTTKSTTITREMFRNIAEKQPRLAYSTLSSGSFSFGSLKFFERLLVALTFYLCLF